MIDLKFYQQQARGPLVWGDLELDASGDLATLDRDKDVDTQDAMVRLLSDASSLTGFEYFPQTGASLGRFIGEPGGLDLLQSIDRASEAALRQDRRFPSATQCRTVQLEPGRMRTYIAVPNAAGGSDLLAPPLEFDSARGAQPQEAARYSPWLWRRGLGAIQQSARLWRAWFGNDILWRMTPNGLLTRRVTEEPLEGLGLFHEPLLVWNGGLLFCGRGPREGYYAAQARTTVAGWSVNAPLSQVDALPQYGLPDGVWCDAETQWNIVIIIAGQTAGQFSEENQRWEFRAVTITDSL